VQGLFAGYFWDKVADARQKLDNQLSKQSGDTDCHLITIAKIDHVAKGDLPAELLRRIAEEVLKNDHPDHHLELLYLFITHCIILRTVSVHDRARPLEELSSDLLDLLNDFLPGTLLAAAKLTSASGISLDVDGRVYCSLIKISILRKSTTLSDLVDSSTYDTVQSIWSMIGSPPPNFTRFAAHFLDQPPSLSPTPASTQSFSLLPFDNEVFNDELSLVNVPVGQDDPQSFSHLDFGQGTLFSDTQHWHNQKSILPEHLGGKKPKPVDERARRRALKQNQRFMATMQAQAATLTGASGGSLQQIKIPLVGSSQKVPPKNRPSVTKVRE
jgi:hypothetical protein